MGVLSLQDKVRCLAKRLLLLQRYPGRCGATSPSGRRKPGLLQGGSQWGRPPGVLAQPRQGANSVGRSHWAFWSGQNAVQDGEAREDVEWAPVGVGVPERDAEVLAHVPGLHLCGEGDMGRIRDKGNWYGGGIFKGKGGDQAQWGVRKACFTCGSTEHLARDCPKNANRVQAVDDETPEVLFIGNVQRKEEEWQRAPMKVKLGDFLRTPVKNPKRTPTLRNRFKVLEVNEDDVEDSGGEEVMQIRTVECCSWPAARCVETVRRGRKLEKKENMEDCGLSKNNMEETLAPMREEVKYVQAVSKNGGWLSLGVGDIIIDSAADESCWPAGQGDAFPTVPSRKKLVLKTANGGDMEHHGQKEVFFKCGGENKEPMGLTFQVTDVKKPLLAVRRLVEKGSKVVLAAGDGESYIYNGATKTKVPVKKKGGSFVIEAHFMKQVGAPGFARQA